MSDPLVEVRGLTKDFRTRSLGAFRRNENLRAVDDVSFTIERGTTLGLVGQSGSGKSTVARCIVRLTQPTSGSVRFDGLDLTKASRRDWRAIRRRMQMVFQDPYSSLDPRMTVEGIVREGLEIHNLGNSRDERRARVVDVLERVGLGEEHLGRYPHEFSGGQRQRIGIARALAVHPEVLICDEPVSSLDVSIAAQIMNLLAALKRDLSLTMLFISHDLAMIRHISDTVAVMHLGRIVEIGTRDEVYDHPQDQYTRDLLQAKSIPDPALERVRLIARNQLTGDGPEDSA